MAGVGRGDGAAQGRLQALDALQERVRGWIDRRRRRPDQRELELRPRVRAVLRGIHRAIEQVEQPDHRARSHA
jgi:hypothetical protein